MHLTVTDATHRIYCRVLRLEVQRTARHQKRKKTTFLQSLTRDISQTNEPILKNFAELKIELYSIGVTKISEIEQIEKMLR
jgi:hypothetical protein